MIVYSSTRKPLQLADTPISKGGEGTVYRIPSLPKYCAKIYHKEKRDVERQKKLEFMVKHAPKDLITPNYIICWPTKLIFDKKGEFLGFVMPLAFNDSILCYNICRMKVSNELSDSWNTCYDRKTKNGLINRLKILVNIAIPVHAIHSLGKYVLVDFKPQNMLITENGRISIIDLDSVQIKDGKTEFFCPVATPDYLPPELQHDTQLGKRMLSTSCDLFALAVIYYQVLYGLHPFTVTAKDQGITELRELIAHDLFPFGSYSHKVKVIPAPHQKFRFLPAQIQQLFKMALGHIPNSRPSAEMWGKTIFTFISSLPNK